MPLGPEAGRIIGSLIEKQLTTPQQYPLTLNALLLACNQVSNRDPVVLYDEKTVEETLASLKGDGFVRFVHPTSGRSVIRFRQVLDERICLDEHQLALIASLLLRGPQTAGELRGRSERMARFEGLDAVETELERMSIGPEPLIERMPRRPGQKEERWVQLLATVEISENAPDFIPGPADIDSRFQSIDSNEEAADETEERMSRIKEESVSLVELASQMNALRIEVAELRNAFEELQTQLGI